MISNHRAPAFVPRSMSSVRRIARLVRDEAISIRSVGEKRMSGRLARRRTGLARQAGARDVFIYNVNFINIAIGVAFMFLFMPNGSYPGVNIYLSTILCTLFVLPTSLVYGMFASAMPRSGGEYVYVSRAVSPLFGFVASWNYTIWCFFYIGVPAAFLGRYGISALFRELGATLGSATMTTWGDWFNTPLGTALTGTVLIIAFAVISVFGVRTYMRIQNVAFYLASLGLAVTAVVLVMHDQSQSIAAFNHYAAGFTGNRDTYAAVIRTLGKDAVTRAPFSLQQTLIAMTWPFTVLGFSMASAYIGGEIKDAGRSQVLGMPGSLIYSASWILALSYVTLHAFGFTFLADLATVDPPMVKLAFAPTFSELAATLSDHIWLVLVIGVSFALWTYTWLPIYILTATRNLLAWALDGLLPDAMSEVDGRTHSPLGAIVFSSVLGVIFLCIYAYDAGFATISGFFGQVCGTFLLTSLAAIAFPYSRKDMFEASPIAWRLAGIPVLAILGVLSAIGMLVIAWAFLNDPQSGISFAQPFMLLINLAVFASGFVFFYAVKLLRRRQGIDINLRFLEIPPE
jgi:amino acid transporter